MTAGCNFTIISWWYQRIRPNASVDTSNMPLVVFFTSDFDNRRAGFWLIKLTDWIAQRRSNVSALQVATSDAYCQSYYATYCAIWFGNYRMLRTALVNYGMCDKQAALRSKFIAMTRFYDLKFGAKTKTTSKTYRYNEICVP